MVVAREGVWDPGDDDLKETSTVEGLGPPSQATEARLSDAAGSNRAPASFCFGPGICPWCYLHCTPLEHGKLAAAAARYYKINAAASVASVPLQAPEEHLMLQGLKCMLGACAVMVRAHPVALVDQLTARRLQAAGLLPCEEDWPEALTAISMSTGAPGKRPPADDDAFNDGGGNSRKRRKPTRGRVASPAVDFRRSRAVPHHQSARRREDLDPAARAPYP